MDQPLQLNCGNTSTLSQFISLGTKMEEGESKGGDRQTDTQHLLELIVNHISFLFSQATNISSKHTTKTKKSSASVCQPLSTSHTPFPQTTQISAEDSTNTRSQYSTTIKNKFNSKTTYCRIPFEFSSTWVRLPPQFTHISISNTSLGTNTAS